jgi:hypothetical protein
MVSFDWKLVTILKATATSRGGTTIASLVHHETPGGETDKEH